MGINTMRHNPAAILPHNVLTGNGNDCVAGMDSNRDNTPTLAAVSPNRVNGPCTIANGKP